MADPSPVRGFDLPFREQAEFWRRKVNVPTATYRDLEREAHAPGFMVAGAARADLLDDLRRAVDKVTLAGGTLEGFRLDFDALVARTGWSYTGGRNWRTRIIYETNVRSAYMAGRWTQMQAIKHRRPFWQYVHNDSVQHPRVEHVSWNGIVLSADDPWWSTHYAPNGYGCQCYVTTLAQRDLDRLGKAGPDVAPTAVEDTQGIDPGFDYNVGAAAGSLPAAVRFGQKVMQLPPAWRDVALADAQRRPTDTFADWAGMVKRVVGELDRAQAQGGAMRPRGSTHPVAFLRPQTATPLQEVVGQGTIPATAPVSTALLCVDDQCLLHVLRSAQGADALVLRESADQWPSWLADAHTAVFWDRNEGNLVYARRLDDERSITLAFGLDETTEPNPGSRRAKLAAHRLRTASVTEAHNLTQTHYILLDGAL